MNESFDEENINRFLEGPKKLKNMINDIDFDERDC
jgi:hypothetical protein